MKTILANVSNSFFVRNFLRSDALRVLEKSGRVRLVLLAPGNKIDYYKKEFRDPFITFDVLPDVRNSWTERFFKFLETASIHTRTSYMLSKSHFHRRGSRRFFLGRLLSFMMRCFFWQAGQFALFRALIRGIYFAIPNEAFDELLGTYKPDLVFLPTLIYAEDYVLAKAAKKRGIKTLGMTLSWDNFYSKTFLLVKPDELLVHTELIVEQAKKLGDYWKGRITATGIPQYDRYFRRDGLLSRKDFFEKIGADQSGKLILYAFSGKAGLDIEFSVLDILHSALKKGEIPDRAQVLLRPYPRYDFPIWRLEELKSKYGFMAFSPVAHPFGTKGDWEFDQAALDFLAASLAHSDIVITMYSTFFIEAAIFDKPLVAVGFDGDKKLDYWNSARRFFDWNHLAELRPLGGIKIVGNKEEFLEAVNKYLAQPSWLAQGRRKIVLQQCQFTDGCAGERVAKTILRLLGLN